MNQTASHSLQAAVDVEIDVEIDVDVAIVGGGMVGMALACALGGSELSVALIDPLASDAAQRRLALDRAAEQGFDSRVSALNLASEQILRNLGVWTMMQQQRVAPYRQMQVWDGEGTAEIVFSAAEQHQSHLGHIVENRVTLMALHQALTQHDNIQWLGGAGLQQLSGPCPLGSALGVAATRKAGPEPGADSDSWRQLLLSDGRRINARLVVAADGAHSSARRLAGVPLSEWDYQQHAIVTTVTTEKPHQATAWQRFTDDGPLALLPLSGTGHQVSIVWSTSPDHAQALMALSANNFAIALGQAFEYRLGAISDVDTRAVFPLVQRHAKRYVEDSLALVGDAAHTLHPLAGQGVNLGLLDAATLAEELLKTHQQGLALGDCRRLRRYQRRRQGQSLAMLGLMAGFRHLYAEVPPPLHWLRNLGMKQVAQSGVLKRQLVRHALGLEGDLPLLAKPDLLAAATL
ncbi:MAG: UbiH/UbiF/VisC/COQ6 family ubiquinone biosynthesis hydroxylase [Motiliproteus sp.]